MRTDTEPAPRIEVERPGASLPNWSRTISWSLPGSAPEATFASVLDGRRSSVGGPLSDHVVAAVLHHASALRFRRDDGRFGVWESRPSPSAGGMSALRLLVLPMEREMPAGLYDADGHALLSNGDLGTARALNAVSTRRLASATAGTTVQLLAHSASYDACYTDPETLMWRDAGALCATLALVATACSLCSVVLGRIGNDIVAAAGLDHVWQGAGAVHISAGDGRPKED